jgi:hypothetical protein
MTQERLINLILRLRQARMASHYFSGLYDLCEEAAEEIEQLKQDISHREIDIETQSTEIARLRSELSKANPS